jgi:hypothetical protein
VKGRAAGGGSRRRRGFRGGGLAGDAQTGAPGVNPTRAWVGEQRRGTCSPPVHTGQGIRARVGPAAARGGSGSPANCVDSVPASIRFGFSCWGFYKVRPSYTRCSSGLRRSRAKPGHGAVAAQRRRPLTGLLGDLRTTGARAKRKRRSGRGSPGVESDGAQRRRDVGGEVVPRVAAALEGEAAAVELRPF